MDEKRVIAAVVLIPAILLFTYFAPPFLWLLLVSAIGFISFKEYQELAPVKFDKNDMVFGHSLNALSVVLVYFTENMFFALFVAFMLLIFYHIIKSEEYEKLVKYLLRDLLGVLYCAILPSFILLIRIFDGRAYIYLILITIWVIDSCCYYVGSLLGKNKLLPNISPNKTIEGAIGGIIGAIAIVVIAKILYFKNFSYNEAVIFGFVLSISAQLGDLFESLLKRARGIKDSGDLIPGHGGMLDRIDSLLFSAPAFFYFTLLLNL